jgi:hypothetical protein
MFLLWALTRATLARPDSLGDPFYQFSFEVRDGAPDVVHALIPPQKPFRFRDIPLSLRPATAANLISLAAMRFAAMPPGAPPTEPQDELPATRRPALSESFPDPSPSINDQCDCVPGNRSNAEDSYADSHLALTG